MKYQSDYSRAMIRSTSILLLLTAASHAGDAKSAGVSVEPAPSRWKVGAAYAPIFGLDAEFKGLGTSGSAFVPQPIAPGTNYEYDNGYVRVDSSGNLGGETWNWGYEDASQVSGNQVAMSLSSSNGDASAREHDEIAQGVDLFAYLDMGKVTLGGKDASWGFRAGLHYGRADIGHSGSLTAGTTTITDTYTLTSGVMPGAPYNGTPGGPGPMLGETPVRDIVSGAATVTGSRDLDVHLTTLNFGAYLEIPVAEKFSVSLEGGLSAALADGEYEFDSTTTLTGVGTVNSSGRDSDTKVLPGLYLGASALYQINDQWGLQFSGRYQYMDNFSLEDNGSEATLKFDSAFILSAGVVYSF